MSLFGESQEGDFTMATQKQERQLNQLWDLIKSKGLTKEQIQINNMKGFLYSVGRVNILEMVAILITIGLQNKLEIQEMTKRLSD